MNTQPSVDQIVREITVLKAWVRSMDDHDKLARMSKNARAFVLLQMYENRKAIVELTVMLGEIQMRQELSRLNVSKWTATLQGRW